MGIGIGGELFRFKHSARKVAGGNDRPCRTKIYPDGNWSGSSQPEQDRRAAAGLLAFDLVNQSLRFQFVDDERDGRTLERCFRRNLSTRDRRPLSNIIQHNLTIDIANRV